MLGSKCSSCGITDIRVLQIDHVFGGGVRQLRKIAHNYISYFRLIQEKGIENYQLLCANCNWIKRYEKKNVKQIRF